MWKSKTVKPKKPRAKAPNANLLIGKAKNLNSMQRIALRIEFEKWVQEQGYTIEKEVLFRTLLSTKRKYAADYVLRRDGSTIIVEINGGQKSQGRHNNGFKSESATKLLGYEVTNYENDLMKINLAQKYKIPYFQYTYEMLTHCVYKEDLI